MMPELVQIGNKWYFQTDEGAAKQERDEAIVQEVRQLKDHGFKIKAIADHFGLSVKAVSLMLNGH